MIEAHAGAQTDGMFTTVAVEKRKCSAERYAYRLPNCVNMGLGEVQEGIGYLRCANSFFGQPLSSRNSTW